MGMTERSSGWYLELMQHSKGLRGAVLAGIVAFCAAQVAGVGPADARPTDARPADSSGRAGRVPIGGSFGAYLEGRFALEEADADHAAERLLKALSSDPGNAELVQQAFLATLMSGRPEAARLARELPDNQAAQLLLGDVEAKNGNWEAAEQHFNRLPRQGLTQVLQPLLVAWAQQGAHHTDAALATLRPYVEGQRFRGVYTLHAAAIADLAGRTAEAARLYRIAQSEYGATNLRLVQFLASWQARQGHPAEAQKTIRGLTEGIDEMSIVIPAMNAAVSVRPVTRATDGIAEAYLALAAAVRQQDAADFSQMLLRLALGLRPDLTSARLLLADIQTSEGHPSQAEATLAPVGAGDPLLALVRLRRAGLAERGGNTEQAIAELEHAAREYPDSPMPLAQEGDLLRSKNRFADAVAAYDRALARMKAPLRSAWPLFYARGIAQERSHDWPKAQADLQRALELSPDQPYVLNYLGYTWADQGQHLQQALQMLTRAVELRPNDGSIMDSLGWVLLRQGDTGVAVKTLERAVELMPEDATINGHLGDAYWASGRKLEAEFQWRRALILKPDPEEQARLEKKLHEYAAQAGVSETAEHHVQ
jgi:tetratricopeptide (TPR) repeat protein